MKTLTLAEHKTTAYRIVCAISPDPAVKNAAAELSAYFTKITDAPIETVMDDSSVTEKELVVGICTARNAETVAYDISALGEDGFVIRAVGEKLYLLGASGRGTLYAVYDFLEKFAGSRFYASYFEKIPQLDTFTVPADINVREVPVFDVRNTFWYDYTCHDEFCAKRKANGRKFRPIEEKWGGSANWAGGACHTLYALAEMDKSGAGHINTEPCLCDETVYETVLKNVRASLHAHPGARFISVSQNDSGAEGVGCQCEKCTALLEKTGSYAGSYILFVNRIADAIREEFPDVMIHTFAYRFTRKAPIGVKPRPNVTVEMCTIEGCFRHPLDECDAIDDPYMKSDSFPVLIRKWSALSETLSIWDYTTDFAHYSLTFPNFEVMRKNVRLFAENHAKYIFEQGAYTSRNCEFCELRGYLFSKLLWDPYMTKETYASLANEFIDDYYGRGADDIRAYLAAAMEETKDHHMTVYDAPHTLYPPTKVQHHADSDAPALTAADIRVMTKKEFTPYLTWYSSLTMNPVLAAGQKYFAHAAEAEQDPVLLEHIETSALQVTYLASYYHRAVLDLEKENLTQVLNTVEGLSEEERSRIVLDMFVEKEEAYRNFNNAMIDAMIAHNASDIREGLCLTRFPREKLHLENNPLGWV